MSGFNERREGVTSALVWMMDQPEVCAGGQTAGRIHAFVARCAKAWGIDLSAAIREKIEHNAENSKPGTSCTCPSGDGSLRWPCPIHPSEIKPSESWEIRPGAIVSVPKLPRPKPNPLLWTVCSIQGHQFVPLLRWSWPRRNWYWFGEHCRRCDTRRPSNPFRFDLHRKAIEPWLKGYR